MNDEYSLSLEPKSLNYQRNHDNKKDSTMPNLITLQILGKIFPPLLHTITTILHNILAYMTTSSSNHTLPLHPHPPHDSSCQSVQQQHHTSFSTMSGETGKQGQQDSWESVCLTQEGWELGYEKSTEIFMKRKEGVNSGLRGRRRRDKGMSGERRVEHVLFIHW
jgi:hypothetical protein